jgi:hypothetical protein
MGSVVHKLFEAIHCLFCEMLKRKVQPVSVRRSSACAVAVCGNGPTNCTATFHKFPNPSEGLRLKAWVIACKRQDQFDPSHASSKVCSDHFTADDYEGQLQAEMCGSNTIRLKNTAVPSVYLDHRPPDNYGTGPESISNRSITRDSRYKKREAKQIVHELIYDNNPTNDGEDLIITEDNTVEQLSDQNQSVIASNALQQLNIERKERKRLEKVRRRLLAKIHAMKQTRVTISRQYVVDEISKILQPYFTPTAIECFIRPNKKPRWTMEDISRAITLRYLSRRTYLYIRQQLKHPLPALSTLRKWMSSFHCYPGILDQILKLLETRASGFSEMERCVILSFDEMKVFQKMIKL